MQEIYQKYRPYLFAVAYNILGEIQEAEDLVQDAFEVVLKAERDSIRNIKPYLTRIVANKAIDRLEVLKKQREQYPGTWLPEPLISSPEEAPQEGILQWEVLHALSQLNPVERAAFVLRTAFDYSYGELSQICNTSEVNCRQLVRRARQKVSEEVKEPAQQPAAEPPLQQLVEMLLQSSMEGNPEQLARFLQKDIALYSDGGGKVAAALNVLWGSEVVSKFLMGIARKNQHRQLSYKLVLVNNQPAVILYLDGALESLFHFKSEGGIVSKIFVLRNPDKIILK